MQNLSPSDKSKTSTFVKNKWIEQYYNFTDYKGKDKKAWESTPYDHFFKKCVLERDNCVQKKIHHAQNISQEKIINRENQFISSKNNILKK